MGELSTLLFSAPVKEPRRFGLSCSGLFPCAYHMYLSHSGKMPRVATDARIQYNLDDGWDQEDQSVKRLKAVGVIVENRGMVVSIGKTKIQGHIDGTVTVRKKTRLWEHKAMDGYRFSLFKSYGLKYFSNYKCQIHSYLLGLKLDEASVMVKNKESNDYEDIVEFLDLEFITPIIDIADEVRSGWVPEPKESEVCTQCNIGCFGTVLDFSNVASLSNEELAAKWRQGDKLYKLGSFMRDQCKEQFKELLGGNESLLLEGLRIRRITQNRTSIDGSKVLSLFGPDALLEVTNWSQVESLRVNDTVKGEESE